jgi:predicted GH43/DUF377 family glycosyl hydrolase
MQKPYPGKVLGGGVCVNVYYIEPNCTRYVPHAVLMDLEDNIKVIPL